MIYAASVFIFLFIWTGISALFILIFYRQRPIDKLKYFDEEYIAKERIDSGRRNKMNLLKFLAALIPDGRLNEKRKVKVELELMKADIPLTAEEFTVIQVLCSLGFFFLGFIIFKSFIASLFTAALSWNLPKLIITSKKNSRIQDFNYQLNEGIMIIANSLKAGYSFLQAVAVVVEETKAPFSKEFRKLLKEMSLGVSEEHALQNLLTRMESEDLKLVVNAILIQKDVGGNLSEILENIGETIRERQKIQNELKTLTAQGRLSGIIVMLLPIFLGIIIYIFNKEYILLLFNTTTGVAMIAAAVFNQFIGFMMIRKIIKIDM
jgi:tight adherence protein B